MQYKFYKDNEPIAIFYDSKQVKKFIKRKKYKDNPIQNQEKINGIEYSKKEN